jgi:hypothetical protein
MSQRGQASVELVAGAGLLVAAALAVCQLLLVGAAEQRAGRVAGQAAVLLASGRPLPSALRREAEIQVRGGTVTATVTAPSLPGLGPFRITRDAHLG